MRKILKKTLLVITLILATLVLDVSAATTAPSTLKAGSNTTVIGPYDGLTTYFGVKTFIDGGKEKYAYCINDITKDAPHNVTLYRSRELDAGYAYIVKNGYPSKSITGGPGKDYYITQAAVWWYTDSIGGSTGLRSAFKNSNVTSSVQAKKLVNGALNARKKGYAKPSMKLSSSSLSLKKTSDGKYYESGLITVTTTAVSGNYKVSLTNAPSGTTVVNSSGTSKTSFAVKEKFKVRIPVSKITKLSYSFSAKVSATGSVDKAYEYKSNYSSLQSILIMKTYPVTTALSATVKFSVSTSEVKISKQDVTTKKELPGATLVVKNSSGKQVDKWTSNSKPHYIKGLADGKYTLTETAAPNGYDLSTEKITFTVKSGKSTSVVMYNAPKKATIVKISKQDITTKQELPGATLVVKDSSGKQVDKWTSTNEIHYINNLSDGKYTLTETIAPNGYELSTETIEFEVKSGKTTSVVMYNIPKKPTTIKVSKQDITNKKELPGATLVVKDSAGNIVDKWISTNEVHYLKDLKVGKYTLSETIAPNGYDLSNETIEFEVKQDGKITPIIMYNAPKKVTIVKISKQDITNKKELPGATLELRDSTGKLINTWVSTNEPYYISGLKEGKYTLKETIAPKGYDLSSETIEFEVKNDGKINIVVMYNKPTKETPKEEEVEVPITDTNISPIVYALGLSIIASGAYIVIKTAKKENK